MSESGCNYECHACCSDYYSEEDMEALSKSLAPSTRNNNEYCMEFCEYWWDANEKTWVFLFSKGGTSFRVEAKSKEEKREV